ncbi:MAG: glycosyltransferase family 2 protein, partial [Planctomycetota bacterium]
MVIPTFNRRDGVGGAIESIRHQTFEDFELLVVDDGSTDGTAAVLRERYRDDDRIHVLEKPNRGCGSARNHGIVRARGELVAYLDSDDHAESERLARQVEALDAHPEADLCLVDARLEDGEGRPVGTMYAHSGFVAPTSLEAMFQAAWAAPSTWMLRTEVARALPFDEAIRYQEDVDFLFRFLRAGHRVVMIPDVLVRYQVDEDARGEGRMSGNRPAMDAWWARIHRENWERLTPAARREIHRPPHVH